MNELKFFGSADSDCISCDEVEFYFWDFEASETYIELCPYVTPVHGIMYRGFVRDWLTDELIIGHKPFIKSIRSILLSPFAIIFVAILVLLLVYLLGFVIEYVLIKANLQRENPYAAVPVTYCENDDYYDGEYHNIDASLGKQYNYYNQTIWFGNSGVKTAFENLGMTNSNENKDENENKSDNKNDNDGTTQTVQISSKNTENGTTNTNISSVEIIYTGEHELQTLKHVHTSNEIATASNFHD